MNQILERRLSSSSVVAPKKCKDDIICQIIAWHPEDVDMAEINGEEDSYNDYTQYVIKCFGVDKEGKSVAISITDFTPYFYIKVNELWTDKEVKKLKEFLVNQLHPSMHHNFISATLCQRKDFWGFTNFQSFPFVRFVFRNQKTMRSIQYKLQSTVQIPTLGTYKFQLYESNIDPFIRFIHCNNLEPTGWLRIPAGLYKNNTEILPAHSDIDVQTNWKNVQRHECLESAPFVVLSFDIECMSKTGQFPVPTKDYKILAMQIYDLYSTGLKPEWSSYKKMTIIQNAIMYAFSLDEFMFKHRDEEPKDEIDTFPYQKFAYRIEFKNERQMSPKEKQRILNIIKCKIDDIMTHLEGKSSKIMKKKKDSQDPDFDKQKHIHIVSELSDEFNNLGFPAIKGDEIIQIGSTVHLYGERECSYRHIITLGETSEIEGVVVESCDTEIELLMKWRNLINRLNPDIITGFNIFGFDFPYIYERACDLKIDGEFMLLSRLKGVKCEFKENKLSSSALGDNILRFIDMQGRVLIDMMKVIQRDHKLDSYKLDNVAQHFMGLKKNDVSPQDIFRLQLGSSEDRKIVAEYCVKDCELCNNLMIKLEIIANNMGMSNVCLVPLAFIFMRGQGIKIFSLVLKECRDNGYLIPVVKKSPLPVDFDFTNEEESSYEGAIVLDPKEGIYLKHPVSVMDYSSLYPSSMISENLSHDCIVLDKKYDNLPGVTYLDISYDKYQGKGDKKEKTGIDTSRFVQLPNNEKGIIPRILMKLLSARKSTRKRIENKHVTLKNGESYKGAYNPKTGIIVTPSNVKGETKEIIIHPDDILTIEDEYNDFQKAVLDGLQNAYKVTANSLYGQMGASTSQLYLKEIAACTTATGRNMILKAKAFLEEKYNANIVYGDTDSVFAIFPNKDENGQPLEGHAAIKASIATAIKASNEFKSLIKKPHDLEYEKTFWPFILLSKKRYVGNLYEQDDKKFKQKSMGIVLKRRDNAPIVKTIYGGIIDIILNKQDIHGSIEFLKKNITELVNGHYPLEELVITKSLRGSYKNPTSIAHKVLADRMAERDPGDKPQVNDRIPYAYIQVPNSKKVLQGERIEHPNYIRKHNLKIDYNFYLTNQIMNSVNQVYGIIAEQIPGNPHNEKYYEELWTKINNDSKYKNDIKKAKLKYMDERERDVQALLFDPFIEQQNFIQTKNHTINEYFKPKTKSDQPLSRPTTRASTSSKKTLNEDQSDNTHNKTKNENKDDKVIRKRKTRSPNIESLTAFYDAVENETIKLKPSTLNIREKAQEMRKEKKSYKAIAEELNITVYQLRKILD